MEQNQSLITSLLGRIAPTRHGAPTIQEVEVPHQRFLVIPVRHDTVEDLLEHFRSLSVQAAPVSFDGGTQYLAVERTEAMAWRRLISTGKIISNVQKGGVL